MEELYRTSQTNKSENNIARLFFKHFQLLEAHELHNAVVLSEGERFSAVLHQLDATTLRQKVLVPLLYLKSASAKSYEIDYHEDGSFNDFLASLGLMLDTQHIKTGNFDHATDLITNTGIVYNATAFCEQFYLVPSLRRVTSMMV